MQGFAWCSFFLAYAILNIQKKQAVVLVEAAPTASYKVLWTLPIGT